MLTIALAGFELAALDGIIEAKAFVHRLKRGGRDAWAELLAIRISRGLDNRGEVSLARQSRSVPGSGVRISEFVRPRPRIGRTSR